MSEDDWPAEDLAKVRKEYMDNKPACGAPKGWRWGYLPCGCANDGYGRHLRGHWVGSPEALAREDAPIPAADPRSPAYWPLAWGRRR